MRKALSGIAIMVLALITFGLTGSQAVETVKGKDIYVEQAYEFALRSGSTVEAARIDVEKAESKVDWTSDIADDIDGEAVDTYEKAKAKVFGPAQAKSELYQANEKLKQAEGQLKKEVDQAYFGVIKARKQVESAQAAYKRAEEQLQVANSKFKAGRTAKTEVLEAEIQADNAEAVQVDAENNEKTAMMKLNLVLGLDLDMPLILKSRLVYSPPPKIKIEEETYKALSKRLDIMQSRESVELKRIEKEIAYSFYGPGVYIYEEDRYNLLQAESQLKEKIRTAPVTIKIAYLNMLSLDRQYHLAEKSVKQAQEALKLAQKRYEVGLVRMTEVTSASAALCQAESKLVDMLYQYHLSKIQFSLELGQY